MNQLHPGARWLFRIHTYFLMIILGFFFVWFFMIAVGFIAMLLFGTEGAAVIAVLFSILAYILFSIIVAEIYARMAYTRWLYEFGEDGLRIERGIIWKRYSNVPYERIQNVDIHRGIIARIFGFSSLLIQTAGYSAQMMSEGYIPAIDPNLAEQLREGIMKRITRRRN
jgi:membrane protein YdbS with pleckstrin-like domain